MAFNVIGYQQRSTEIINTRVGGTACNGEFNGFLWPLCFSLLILHDLIWANPTYLTTNSYEDISIYRLLVNYALLLLFHSVNSHINHILWALFPDWRCTHTHTKMKCTRSVTSLVTKLMTVIKVRILISLHFCLVCTLFCADGLSHLYSCRPREWPSFEITPFKWHGITGVGKSSKMCPSFNFVKTKAET